MPHLARLTPLLMQNGSRVSLRPVRLDDREFDEAALQELLFENPDILPLDDMNAGVESLVAIAREVDSGGGPIDLLCIDPVGNIVLVETKLWRNPQARREVVAQIIDYASNLALKTYEELVERVRAARPDLPESADGDALVNLISEESGVDLDEAWFVDRVTSNLSAGRMVLLIVGDGIKSGIETMAGFLQQQPHLGFTLGLVELQMFRLGGNAAIDQNVLVVPRVIGQTREVVRSIVEIRHAHDAPPTPVKVTIPEETPDKAGKKAARRTTISEQSFFEELAKNVSPELYDLIRASYDHFDSIGLEVEWATRSGQIRYIPNDGPRKFLTLFKIDIHGMLADTGRLSADLYLVGLDPDPWQSFLGRIQELIPGTELRVNKTKIYGDWTWLVTRGGSPKNAPSMEPLVGHTKEWLDAIDDLVARLDRGFRNEAQL